MMDEPCDDSFVEVYVLGPDEPYLIYPAWFGDETEFALDRALREPQTIYEALSSDVQDASQPRSVHAYYGWPEVLIFLSGAAASGVTGNAVYDLFKTTARAVLSKTSRQARNDQCLSQVDAIELARTFVRSWQDHP